MSANERRAGNGPLRADGPPLLVAIDQGTTGSTVLVLEVRGAAPPPGGSPGPTVVGRGYRELPQHYPQPGWVEHDCDELWRSVTEALGDALRSAADNVASAGGNTALAGRIAAIGLTNQRETTVLWDRATGRPLHRAIVWQDRRTAQRCADLRARGLEPLFRRRTGLVLDPYFSGTKLAWLLDPARDAPPGGEPLSARAARGELAFGTVDSYLVARLTGGAVHVTDVSNASRTLLLNLDTLDWDDELCDALQLPRALLPRLCENAEVVGTTSGVPHLPDGIPIAGLAGDQQAALFGHLCLEPGQAKCTYGTGAFLLLQTGKRPVDMGASDTNGSGLLSTVAWKLNGRPSYALEGSAFVAGAMVQWLRDGLGIIDSAADVEALAASVPDSGGVMVVPALTGLGAPHWRPEARGLISGLTRGTTAAHLARATLEGIALQIVDLLVAMEQELALALPQARLSSLHVDGGAAGNDLLMQLQADLLGCEIVRPAFVETTAMGAALLAGLGVGLWPSADALAAELRPRDHGPTAPRERHFVPTLSTQQRQQWRERWRRSVAHA